jgi:hypothetical protein
VPHYNSERDTTLPGFLRDASSAALRLMFGRPSNPRCVQVVGCITRCILVSAQPKPSGMGGTHPLAPGDLPGVSSSQIGITDEIMVISRPAQMGWIEQVSPACAAASVAGALNGLLSFQSAKTVKREDQTRPVSQADVLKVREQLLTLQ